MGFLDYLYFLVFFAPALPQGLSIAADALLKRKPHLHAFEEYADLLARGNMLLLIGAVYQKVLGTVFWLSPAPLGDVRCGASWRCPGESTPTCTASTFASTSPAYSLMAMGASYCFGIKTPRNFRAPFLALDVREFGIAGFITLSTWLRDFVFMRVVKSATRRKLFKSACIRLFPAIS